MNRAGLASWMIPAFVAAAVLFMPAALEARSKQPHYHPHAPAQGASHQGRSGQPRFAAKPPGHARAHPRARSERRAVVQHHHYHYHPRVPAARGPVAAYPRRQHSDHYWMGGGRVLSEFLHPQRH